MTQLKIFTIIILNLHDTAKNIQIYTKKKTNNKFGLFSRRLIFQSTAWYAYFGTFPVGQPYKALPDTPTLGHFLSINLPKHCLMLIPHNVSCRSTFQSTAWYAYFGSLPVNQPSEALPDTPTSDNILSTKSPKHCLIRQLWIISSRLTFQSTAWSTKSPKHCLIRLLWIISSRPTFQSTAWYANFGTFPVNQPSEALPDTPTLEHFLSTNLPKHCLIRLLWIISCQPIFQNSVLLQFLENFQPTMATKFIK